MRSIRDQGNVSISLAGLDVVQRFRTKHYRAAIFRHPQLGRALVLNGEIQHVEAWAPLYHEPLVHLAAAFVRRPRRVLIIGGGSFFAAKEVLRYRSVERLLMVDHDPQLLDKITAVYEHAAGVRLDARLEIQSLDGLAAASRLTERFDLVINDSIDLMSRHGPRAFSALASLLTKAGACSDVVYRHVFEDRQLTRTLGAVTSRYHTACSLIFVPEYPGVLHLLTLWGHSRVLNQNRRLPVNEEQLAWVAEPRENPCSYFDPRFMSYYLHLPSLVRARIGRLTERRA